MKKPESLKKKTERFWHLNNDFLTVLLGGRLPETKTKEYVKFLSWKVVAVT